MFLKFLPPTILFVALCLVGCAASPPDEEAEPSAFEQATPQVAKIANMDALEIDPDSFVDGNLYFMLYHEMAHALISEFELPVVGREEDAADRLATLIMTPEDKDDDSSYLIGAMRGWFLAADETPLSDIEWWDEHGTDQQRGYQISCLLFGADPERFESVAEAVKLPQERRETCEEESTANQNSWATLFDSISPKQTAPDKSVTVKVLYQATQDYQEEMAYLKDLGALEEIAESLSMEFQVKPGIIVEADECNESNAYWNAEDRKLTLCYEMVEELQASKQKVSDPLLQNSSP